MQITSNHPVRVSGPTNIKNLGTGTLYYDSTQDVSSSNNEGSLTTNQSVDLADDKYVISSAISDILIDPYSRLAPLDLLGGTSGTVIGSDGLPVSVVSTSHVETNVEDYLAGAGSTSAGIQSAITAATQAGTVAGAVVFKPGKTYTLDTATLKLARSLPGLVLDGQWCTLKLAVAAPRAFDWDKVADYDLFQNITIRRFIVDCDNIGGRNHVVVGPWQAGTWQRKINLDNITVEDIRITNAPVGTDSATDFRIGVHIGGQADNADTQCTFTNCTVRRIYSTGCLQLVAIHGVPVTTTANTWHDNILVEEITHNIASTPTAFNAGAHVMAGTKGQGGTITLRKIRGKNSPDVGIEWDGWQDAFLDDCVIEDSYDFGFYHVNYQLPTNPEAQLSTFTKCVARRRNLNDHGQGFKVDVANSNRPGSLHFGAGCLYHRMASSAGLTVQNEGVDILASRRVSGDIKCVLELPDYAGGSDVSPSAIRVRSDSTSNRCVATFNASVKVTGSRSGSGLVNWRSLLVREGLIRFDIDLSEDVVITNGGNAAIMTADMGATSGTAVLSGRLKVEIVPGSRGNTPIGVQFESGAINSTPTSADEILLHDSNFAGIASTSTDVSFAGATTLANRVRFANNFWRLGHQARLVISATGTTNVDARYDYIGVTAAGATIALPIAAKTPTGKRVVIADEVNGAATNNIVITVQSAGTFANGGAASKTINTNGGSKSFVFNGTAWQEL